MIQFLSIRSGSAVGPVSGRFQRSLLRGLLPLLLFLLLPLASGMAQFQLGASATVEGNTNPNQISKKDAKDGQVGDLLNNLGLSLGYNIILSNGVSLNPSYGLGLTLWGRQADQNFIQHDLSLTFQDDHLALFGTHQAAPAVDSVADDDSAKTRLVDRLYAIGERLDSARIMAAPVSAPASGAVVKKEEPAAIDTSGGEDDDLDLLMEDDDTEDTTAVEPPAATGVGGNAAADSLKYHLVERLLGIADSLDINDGSQELTDVTAGRIRSFENALRSAFPDEAFTTRANHDLDVFLVTLRSYTAPGDDITDLALDESSFIYAPMSISLQPLMRNTRGDYSLFTSESDTGANTLRASFGLSKGSYLSSTDDTLNQYENTTTTGDITLQQELGRGFNIWGSYAFTSEKYSSGSSFSNLQHGVALQLRYQPSRTLMLAADAEYSVKRYDQAARPGETVAADSSTSTSLTEVGLGVFFRPFNNTSFGIVAAHQSTPELHPRLLISTRIGRGGRVVSSTESNLRDDIFSWNGNDLQLVVAQGLPLDLVGTFFFERNSRDYGQMDVTLNRIATRLSDRVDTHTTFELNLSRDFYFSEDGGGSVFTANLTLGTVRNVSTNYKRRNGIAVAALDFNYSDNYAQLGVAWSLF
ncbi:MAG: hypothetical protein ABIR47_10100 [Candidatus Kapaibacterium sp.]